MNIHFIDKNLFNKLMTNKLLQIEVGSVMYNLKDEFSDTDYLIIYVPFKNQLTSCFNNPHQLQYKKNNVDYIFVDLITFIKNTISGDSTINFEICNSTDLLNTKLEFLYENRIAFYNYKLLRSYLGLARRDLNNINKITKHKIDSNRNKNKKLIHAIRGYYTTIQILDSLKYSKISYCNKQSNVIHSKLLNIKDIVLDYDRNVIKKEYMYKISQLRKKLNVVYDTQLYIPTYMLPQHQVIINEYVNTLIENNKNEDVLDLKVFYHSNEFDVKY